MTVSVSACVSCVTSPSWASTASNSAGNDGQRLKHSRQPWQMSKTRSNSPCSWSAS